MTSPDTVPNMKAATRIEDATRIENAWSNAFALAEELEAIEADSTAVSVKTAMARAQTHVLQALSEIRQGLALVRGK